MSTPQEEKDKTREERLRGVPCEFLPGCNEKLRNQLRTNGAKEETIKNVDKRRCTGLTQEACNIIPTLHRRREDIK